MQLQFKLKLNILPKAQFSKAHLFCIVGLRAVEGMVRAVPIEGSGAPVTPRPGSCGGGALCAQDGEAQLPPVGDSPLQALGPGPPNSPHHAHVHINKQPREFCRTGFSVGAPATNWCLRR